MPLPTRNKAERGDYRSYYDDDLAVLVGERFKEDIEYFEYSFER